MTTQIKESKNDLKKQKRDKAIAKEMANLEKLKKQYAGQLKIKEDYVSTHLWEYLRPYTWQNRLPDELRKNLIVMAPAPNGIGKSVMAMCILSSWVEGYEAWSPVDADYPGAVKHDGKYYKASSLGIAPPVDIRVTGEDWDHHLKMVVVKVMKEWFPLENYHIKKNSTGTEFFWTHKKNGSTIELMTHGMEVKLYEGWRGHGWIPDEPPPYSIFKAMARGLAEKKGKILIPTTPLREAWMLDKLVLSNRSDVSIINDLILYDNEDSYDNDNKILDELGLEGKRTKYWREADGQKEIFFDLILRKDLYIGDEDEAKGPPDDQGVSAEKYLRERASEGVDDLDAKINDLIFLRKAKDTELEEKPSRFFGLFKSLVGLVIKEYKKSKHVIPAFKIPVDWPVSVQIDFHLSKPIAVAFYACDEHNRHFVIDEIWEAGMTPEQIADYIIRKKKVDCWNINNVEIDPLSKGDTNYMKNRGIEIESAFSVLEEKLDNEEIEFIGACKDPTSGYSNIKKWLKGPNKIPILYFFDSLQSIKDDRYGHVYEIQRLCYDDKGSVKKENDHFMECLYRYTLMTVEYTPPATRRAGQGMATAGGWMG